MCNSIRQRLNNVIDDYNKGVETQLRTTMELLSMIDTHGARTILEHCPDEIIELIREWYASAPKSKKAWGEEYVFDGNPDSSGLIEYRLAKMTAEEIEARLRVLRDLDNYFDSI